MSDNLDARLSIGLATHPKTKKLIRRLGPAAAWSFVCLILWARANKPDGDLSGMTDEEIELAADWGGDLDVFVATLVDVRFLDGDAGNRRLHDWAEHQPWANGADMRSAKARWNAVKRHHGIAEADRQVPEWASARMLQDAGSTKTDASSNANSSAAAMHVAADQQCTQHASSIAPSPSPSPSVKDIPEAKASSGAEAEGDPNESDGEAGDGSFSLTSATVVSHPGGALCKAVLDAYHETLPECTRIAVLNPKRVKRIQAADKLARQVCRQNGWRYVPDQFWRAYFGECLDDEWLSGKRPNPNNPKWRQNLGVLIDEDRFAQIMDRAIERMKAEEQAA